MIIDVFILALLQSIALAIIAYQTGNGDMELIPAILPVSALILIFIERKLFKEDEA